MYFSTFGAFLAYLVLSSSVQGHDFGRALHKPNALPPRELQAAAREADIATRSLDIVGRNDVLLHYFDDATLQNKNPFAAHVSLSSSRPTLVLEEIDHLLEEVHCEANAIQIKVRQEVFFDVRIDLGYQSDFLLITSHETCNKGGSRKPYIATISRLFDSSDSNLIEFTAQPVRWTDAYSLQVDYGIDHEKYRSNPHDHLRRRSVYERGAASTTAAATPSLSTPAISSESTLATSSLIIFPSATTTVPTSQKVATATFSQQFVDATILPITGSGATNGITVKGQGFPSNLGLQCQNCTFTGDLELTSGSFKQSTSNSSNATPRDVDILEDRGLRSFIESGFVEFTANNLFAHVDLSASYPLDFKKNLTVVPLDIGLPGFTIPDVAVVGPELVIELVLQAELAATANMTFGFEVSVPPNSTAILNIGNVTQSNLTGFGSTTFTSLPFNANIDNISLNLSATLSPQLLVGISFLDHKDTAGAGLFLNLPTLSLSIDESSNTDTKCNPTSNQTLISQLDSEYDAMINIVPNVELAAGFVAQASATLGVGSIAKQTAFTPLVTTFPPPTACLGFKKGGGGFESPTLPPEGGKVAATGTAGAGASSNAAVAARGVRAELGWSRGVVDAMVVQGLVVGGLMVLGPLLVG